MSATESTRRVFLLGFMGAGKTSVGQALARRMGWTFVDLDELIERRQQKSVAAIFAEDGEAVFRRMERAALAELLEPETDSTGPGPSGGGLVAALGGGAFAQPANRNAIEYAGAMSILLEAPIEELRRRCENDLKVRPLARDQQVFAQLFAERRSAYELAGFRADTMGKSVEEVAAEIERMIMATVKPEV
jgi:shikimate kinase